MLKEKDWSITAQAVKDAYLGNHSIQKGKHTLCELIRFHFKIEGEKLTARHHQKLLCNRRISEKIY